MSATIVSLLCNKQGSLTPTTQEETWTYCVQFADANVSVMDAQSASYGGVSIPVVGWVTGNLRCMDVTAQQDWDNPNTWTVTAKLANIPLEPKPSGTDVKWDVSLNVANQTYMEPAWIDAFGTAVVNAAGEPFPQGLNQKFSTEMYSMSFLTDVLPIAAIRDNINKVNSAACVLTYRGTTYNFDTRQLLFNSWAYESVDLIVSGTPLYAWKVTYQFEALIRSGGWYCKVPNVGMYMKDGCDLIVICDKKGRPLSSPAYLTDTGNAVSCTPTWKTFKMEGETGFGNLFLGQTTVTIA